MESVLPIVVEDEPISIPWNEAWIVWVNSPRDQMADFRVYRRNKENYLHIQSLVHAAHKNIHDIGNIRYDWSMWTPLEVMQKFHTHHGIDRSALYPQFLSELRKIKEMNELIEAGYKRLAEMITTAQKDY